MRLTVAKAKSLSKPGMHGDGQGLYLRVKASGAKGWILRAVIDGKRHDIGLGGYPAITLSAMTDFLSNSVFQFFLSKSLKKLQIYPSRGDVTTACVRADKARKLAKQNLKMAKKGLDPAVARRRRGRTPTFKTLATFKRREPCTMRATSSLRRAPMNARRTLLIAFSLCLPTLAAHAQPACLPLATPGDYRFDMGKYDNWNAQANHSYCDLVSVDCRITNDHVVVGDLTRSASGLADLDTLVQGPGGLGFECLEKAAFLAWRGQIAFKGVFDADIGYQGPLMQHFQDEANACWDHYIDILNNANLCLP